MQNGKATSRRAWLMTAAVLVASLTAIPMVYWRRLFGEPNDPRNKYRYQDYPNHDQRCVDCYAYVADRLGNGMGRCIVLSGPVSMNVWCTAYAVREHNP